MSKEHDQFKMAALTRIRYTNLTFNIIGKALIF